MDMHHNIHIQVDGAGIPVRLLGQETIIDNVYLEIYLRNGLCRPRFTPCAAQLAPQMASLYGCVRYAITIIINIMTQVTIL